MLCLGLINEPYSLPFESIVNLTPRQLEFLYYCPRDKKTGAPKTLPYYFGREKQERLEAKAQFINMGMALGHTLESLEKQWAVQYGSDAG